MASTDGCLRLLGSVACPAFEGAYVNPANLSNAFPWMAGVNTVASFDAAVLSYFSNSFQFAQTKFQRQLGCSNASTAVLQYQRTVLCSMWTNELWSRNCQALLDQTSLLNSPKMVCQETCEQFSRSEIGVVNSTLFCPGPDLTGGTREGNITKDYVQCTDWTTLASANTSVCVLGQTNEGNCGFAGSTSQLCSFCDPATATPGSCCYDSRTNLGTCGYVLPALASVSSSMVSASSASAASVSSSSAAAASAGINALSARSGLSGGQIAGIVVGSVLGALLLLALLLFCCLASRRRRRKEQSTALAAAAAGGSPVPNPSMTATTAVGAATPDLETADGRRKSWFDKIPFSGKSGSSAGSPDMIEKTAGGLAPLGAATGGVMGLGVSSMADRNATGDRDGGLGDGFIRPGQVVTVLWAYQSSLPDELDLRPGQRVRIARLFDDAWGFGEFVDGPQSGRQGAFPLVCVTVNGASSSNLATRTSTDSTPRMTSLGLSIDGDQSRPDSPLDPFDRP